MIELPIPDEPVDPEPPPRHHISDAHAALLGILGLLAAIATPLAVEYFRKPPSVHLPSPGGEGQGEGGLPSRSAKSSNLETRWLMKVNDNGTNLLQMGFRQDGQVIWRKVE